MLSYFRKHAQSKAVAILFGLIALTFIFGFGVIGNLTSAGTGTPSNVVVEVGDRSITYGQIGQLAESFEARIGGDLEPQMRDYLRTQALQSLVDRELLSLAAWSEGIRVTDEEVVKKIQENPGFQRDGAFLPDLYHQQLRARRIRPTDYEADMRLQLEIERLQGLLLAGVGVSDAEVEERYRLENERLDVRYLTFDPAHYADQAPEATDDELRAFFAAHPERFETPEKVSVALVVVDPSAIEPTIEIGEGELLDRYDRDLARWDQQESVEARHILIKVPEGADESEDAIARGRAESLLLELDQGADFETLARERSEDPGSAARGGSLGSFERGQMVPEFEKAAFEAEPGTVVGPVRTQFGYHLIQVVARREARTQPFEEVRDALEAELRHEQATEQAERLAGDLAAPGDEGGTLEERAQALGLAVELAGPVSSEEPIAGSRRLTSSAFGLEVGERSQPIRTVRGFEVVELRERTPAHARDFDEARADVAAAVRDERAMQLASERAGQALDKLRAGGDPQAVAEELGAELASTGPFALTSRVLPGLGAEDALRDAALSLSATKPLSETVIESRGKLFVLVFGARTGTEMDDPAQVDAVRQRLIQERRQLALGELLRQLREQHPPKYNQEALDYMLDSTAS